jgi:protein-tyrosine-phosphatase
MAEAFANAYGPDVIDAKSAGLLPARRIPSLARLVMEEKGVTLRYQDEPKGIDQFEPSRFDLIVNMSGHALPNTSTPVVRVALRDPDGKDEMVHRHVRDRVEAMMIDFITRLRSARMDRFHHVRELALAATA